MSTEPYIDIIATFPEVLRDFLRSESSVLGAIGAARVHLEEEPAGEKLPFVNLYYVRGGELNNNPRREADITYKIVAIGHSQIQAAQIAGFIYNALNKTKLALPDVWVNYWTRGYDWYLKGYSRANQKVYEAGRFYNFRVNETSIPTLRVLP